MNMEVGIEGTAHPLDAGQASGMDHREPAFPRPPPLPGKEHVEERAQHGGEQPAIHGQTEAQGPGERQHPLPVLRLRQQLIHQSRRGLRRSPGAARRTDPRLAGKGPQPLEATTGAAQSGEALAEQCAIEVVPELPLDPARVAFPVASAALRQQGLEVLPHHLVQDRLLRFVAPVAGGQGRRGRAGMVFVGEIGERRSGCCRARSAPLSRRRGPVRERIRLPAPSSPGRECREIVHLAAAAASVPRRHGRRRGAWVQVVQAGGSDRLAFAREPWIDWLLETCRSRQPPVSG